jgi:hypothetical protein
MAEIARDLSVATESLRVWVSKPGSMRAGARAFRARSGRSCGGCVARIGCCARSARCCEKPRPSSRGRARPGEVIPLHPVGEGQPPCLADVPAPRCLSFGFPCLGAPCPFATLARGRLAGRADPQYVSLAFGQRCRQARNLRPPSTNRITTTEGDCTRTDEKMIFIEEQAKAA